MATSKLPARASLEHLKKQARNRLRQLRRTDPDANLATALLQIAREHGFPSWRALKAKIDEDWAKNTVPDISAPVMRFIAVADLARSVAFYRDVLGFEVKLEGGEAEAILGPARVRLGKRGYTASDWALENPRPSGSGVLFFQAGDVAATRAAVVARGGSPSEIERVNWIKMQLFEVRDPDGNVLWFGQTYHQDEDSPSRRGSQPHGLRQALPELPFDNVAAAVRYYCEVLGFRINYQQENLGVLDRDAVTILLIERTEQHKGIGSFEVYVSDADALHAEFSAKGARVLGPPVSHPWGLRDFTVLDLEGNRITFAQTFE